MSEKLETLPLGSVVKLKELETEIMIVGQYPITLSDDSVSHLFEYIGTSLPIGIMGSNTLYFNKSDVEETIFIGYKSKNIENFIFDMDMWYSKYKDSFQTVFENPKKVIRIAHNKQEDKENISI